MHLFKYTTIGNKIFLSFSLSFLFIILSVLGFTARYINSSVNQSLVQTLENNSSIAIDIVQAHAEESIRNYLRNTVYGAISTIRYIDRHGQEYNHSIEQRQNDAFNHLLTQKIGETGYLYAINSNGQVLVHPFDDIVGLSLIEYEFVQKQVWRKEGSLEYMWKNPGEKFPRKKVLYMDYFEPWDWIVSVSAYKDEFDAIVNLDEIRSSIQKIRIGERGYLFIMDQDGNILIHSNMEGENLHTMRVEAGLDTTLFNEMINKEDGAIRYDWVDPQTNKIHDKLLFFRRIPELGWVVAASVYTDDYTGFMSLMNHFLLVVLFLSIALFLVISKRLGVILAKPLNEIVSFIDLQQGSDYSGRFDYVGTAEISALAVHVNSFLETLQNESRMRRESEDKNRILAQFPEGNPYPVMRVDESGRILYANPASLPLLNLWETTVGRSLPEDLIDRIIHYPLDFGNIDYNRGAKFYSVMLSHHWDQKAFYLFVVDMTEKKRNEILMYMSESVFANTMEGICITDPNGIIQRINPAFTAITGYGEDEAIGQNPRILKSEHHDDSFYKAMWGSLIEHGTWSGEIWNRRQNGEAYPELLTINSIYDDKKRLIHYVALFKDISDLKRSEDRLKHQAYHDALTGLPNRLLFEDRLTQGIKRAERNGSTLAVLFLDMDNFKTINDSLGHNRGDEYLIIISDRLQSICRGEDTVARLGGDEFVILLPDMQNQRNIVEITNRIQNLIRESVFFEEHEIIPSVSIGVTFYPFDGKDPQLLMKNADMAMYKSKQRGRGVYSLYNQDMNEQFQKRLEMESRMKNALENKEIRIAYQPKVNALNGAVSGFEALVRWNSPYLGNVSPVEFIDLAEETGFIMELGEWVLKKALEDLKVIQKYSGNKLEMAVNLSARQFHDHRLIERIDSLLTQSGVDRSCVNLEITENMAMEDSESSLLILEQLYNLNVKISIDDFGTGYSSYSYLTRFKTNSLKIDKSFVDELPDDEKTAAVIINIIDLGHTLGMEVVAEGVETEEQYLFLKEANCELIQGYYFSRPLLLDDLIQFMKARQ